MPTPFHVETRTARSSIMPTEVSHSFKSGKGGDWQPTQRLLATPAWKWPLLLLLRFKLEKEPWPTERNLENEVCVGNNNFDKQVPKGVLCLPWVSNWPSWTYLKGLTLMGSELVSCSYSTRCVFPCKPHNTMRRALLPPPRANRREEGRDSDKWGAFPSGKPEARAFCLPNAKRWHLLIWYLAKCLQICYGFRLRKSLSYYPP